MSLFSVAIHNCMFTNKETTQYLTQQTPLRRLVKQIGIHTGKIGNATGDQKPREMEAKEGDERKESPDQ